jgi:4-amino-4-deoxy-L-arabinose transferase-like glycosyltransferase
MTTSTFDVAYALKTTQGFDRSVRRLRLFFWLFAILGGALQAWAFRNTITSDGISYLDIAGRLAQGDWQAAVNGYWSPLYPTALALALAIAKPGPLYEFAVVHAANFAIYLVALAGFDFLVARLVECVRRAQRATKAAVTEPLAAWFLLASGYALAVWALLELVTVSSTSPDMEVAVFVFFAAGLLLEIDSGILTLQKFLALGLLLGCGYLAKVPVFLLAFVFFALTLLAPLKWSKLLPKTLAALAAFLLVAAPYVIALSKSKQRLTFGDSGRLNYAWYVDGASYRHWQGEPLGTRSEVAPRWSKGPTSSGLPLHPTRKILDTPPVYEFDGPVAGTYPVWYDPSYWNEGVVPVFDPAQQVRKILVNLKFIYSLLLNVHVVQLYREGRWFRFFSPLLLAVWLVLFWRTRRAFAPFGPAAWPLLLLALAALAMYALVYCEPRHLAPFIVLLYLGLFSAIRFPIGTDLIGIDRRFLKPLGVAIVAAFALTVGISSARLAANTIRGSLPQGASQFEAWQVASALTQQVELAPGSKIASLEYANHGNAQWARLARCRIVAEIYTDAFAPKDPYWKLDPAAQARSLAAFAQTGALLVVASNVPPSVTPPSGWEQIGGTRYFFHRLHASAEPSVNSLAKN